MITKLCRVSAASLLLSFTICLSAYAGPKDRRERFPKNSPPKPLSLEARTTILARQNVLKYAEEHAKFSMIGPTQNRQFIESIGARNKGKLCYLTENAVLKELNDSVLNKDVATALCNRYKQILWRKVQQSRILRSEVIGAYSDWKTVALFFRRDNPKIRQALEIAHRDAATFYAKDVLGRSTIGGEMIQLLQGKGGLASEMTSWHLAGVGATPDQATAAARSARNQFTPGQRPKVLDYRAEEAKISARMTQADNLLQLLDQQLPKRSPVMVSARLDGRRVISSNMIQLIKKTKAGPGAGQDGYVAALKQRVRHRFGVKLTKDQLLMIRDHHDLIDGFSVSIFKEEHKGVNLAHAPLGEITFSGDDGVFRLNSGLVVVDLAGQGVRNHFQTQRAVTRSSSKGVIAAIKGARRAERTATNQMERAKLPFEQAVEKVFPNEFVELTFKRKVALVHELAKSKTPSDYRVTFLPAGSTQPEVAENLEKDLRVALEAVIPFRILNKAILAVDLVPPKSTEGRVTSYGQIDLIVGNLPSKLNDIVHSTLRTLLPRNYLKPRIFDDKGKNCTPQPKHSRLRQPRSSWHRVGALAA